MLIAGPAILGLTTKVMQRVETILGVTSDVDESAPLLELLGKEFCAKVRSDPDWKRASLLTGFHVGRKEPWGALIHQVVPTKVAHGSTRADSSAFTAELCAQLALSRRVQKRVRLISPVPSLGKLDPARLCRVEAAQESAHRPRQCARASTASCWPTWCLLSGSLTSQCHLPSSPYA